MQYLRYSALFLVLLLTLSSCEKDLIQDPIRKKLPGTWTFAEVKFSKDFSFNSDNLTQEYCNNELEIFDDETVTYHLTESGLTLHGTWWLDSYQEYLGEDNNRWVTDMTISVADSGAKNTRIFIWEDITVTKRKIKAQERENKGWKKYKLEKS